MHNEDTRIMIWGPEGVGKTWLLEAFFRKVEILRSNPRPDGSPLPFRVNLKKYDHGKRVWERYETSEGFTKEAQTSTRSIQRDIYHFKKNGTEQGEFDNNINTHSHLIPIIDPPGGVAVGQITDTQFEVYRDLLSPARFLIIVLDSQNKKYYDEYPTILENLKTVLGKTQMKRHLALCVSKLESTEDPGMIDLTGKALLKYKFPADVAEAIFHLFPEGKHAKNYEVRYYGVSACGLYKEDGEILLRKNLNQSDSQVEDPQKWNPINVHKPFFWFLGEIEKERLLRTNTTGLFYTAPFFKSVLKAERLRRYYDYRILDEEAIN